MGAHSSFSAFGGGGGRADNASQTAEVEAEIEADDASQTMEAEIEADNASQTAEVEAESKASVCLGWFLLGSGRDASVTASPSRFEAGEPEGGAEKERREEIEADGGRLVVVMRWLKRRRWRRNGGRRLKQTAEKERREG